MKIEKSLGAAAVLLAVSLAACGSDRSPTAPVVTASATPAPAAAVPAPAPTPTPDAGPTPEPPVTRTTKVSRITLRLFVVLDPSGQLTDYDLNEDKQPIIPLGYQFRLDIVAKDPKNKETMGSGNVIWHFEKEDSVEVQNFVNIFHPRLRASRVGAFTAWAELDGVQSNRMTFEFRN
jgi:hypothetical protein